MDPKKLNVNDNQPKFTDSQKKKLMTKLIEAVSFENFLHTKYVGQKRFSLEGGESLIPALDILIEEAAGRGVEEFVMGMAHRGRLSTLVNIFGNGHVFDIHSTLKLSNNYVGFVVSSCHSTSFKRIHTF